jgi:YD repeat-containing protein
MARKLRVALAARLTWCAGVFSAIALVPLATAQVQVPEIPPKWQSAVSTIYGGLANCPVPFVYEVLKGFGSCSAAGNAQMPRIEENRAACIPPATVVGGCAPFNVPTGRDCPAGPVNTVAWFWMTSTIPINPNTGDGCNAVQMTARCPDGSLAVQDAVKGLHCPRNTWEAMKNRGTCRECVGNPITPGVGNKLQQELDYVGSGPYPLRFERVYNSFNVGTSAWSNQGGLPANWTHNYNRRLTLGGLSSGPVAFVTADRPDGKVMPFARSGAVYVTDADVNLRLEQTVSGWQLINEEDEVEVYDAGGVLQTITNRAGLTHTLAYLPDGKLSSVTDAFGRSLTFVYIANGYIGALQNPEGGQYTFTYRTGNDPNIIKIQYPDLKERTYHYEIPANLNLLTGITDENNVRLATWTYSGAGAQASLSEHAGGVGKVTVSYPNATQRVVTTFVTAIDSAARTYTYQNVLGVRRLTSITGPACPSCGPTAQTHDAQGNIASRTDWNGNRTNFTWDLGRNLETSRTEGLTAAGAATPQTRTITTQWDPTFRLPAGVAEPLRITTSIYDLSGNLLTKSVQATTDANGSQAFTAPPVGAPRVWTYTYNANGQVLTVDGPRTDVSDVTTYTYYANNASCSTANGGHALGCRAQLETVTNALNQTTTVTEYNAHGQPLRMVDPNGLVTTMTYDPRQRLASRTVDAEQTVYEYDNAGQLTKVTLPDSSFLSYTYDAAHRLTGLQDNLGNRIAYTLDLAGNRTQEQVFDSSNALAQTRSRVYSNLNRLFQELGALNQTTEYGYDDQGNVTSVKDPLNRTTANAYDALNRLRQVTDPNLGITQYGYNGLDALVQVIDPRNLATSYGVNGLGDTTQQISPDTGTTASTHDAAGNLLTQTDAKGQTTTYAYDGLNRVTLVTFHDASKQAYAYDTGTNGIGRLASITESDPSNVTTSVIAYAYDAHGRVTSEMRTPGGIVAYSYDASGRMSGMTYPSGRTLTYGFDAAGRVNQVTTTKDAQSQVVVQNVAYHPFGGVKGYTLGNGQLYSRTIDLDGRIAAYTLGGTSVPIGFDAASRITSIGANTYGYDTLDRLSSAILPFSNFGYSYDAVGNRLTKTVGANTDTYTYSASSNRIATLTPAAGPTRSFMLDANGSTTDDGINTYAYDARGRMVQASTALGSATYQLNALGQRIRKSFGTTNTVFTYDRSGHLIAESDPGGTPKREYIYLGDIPVGVIQ